MAEVARLRKHTIDYALAAHCDWLGLVQESDLKSLEKANTIANDPDFHIYIIARRPRVRFIPESVVLDSDTVTTYLLVDHGQSKQLVKFSIAEDSLRDTKVECDDLGRSLRLNPVGYEPYLINPACLLDKEVASGDYTNLEVLYVGKSLGKTKKRTACQRLQGHKTLKQIRADTQLREPHQDIWLILFSFDYDFLGVMNSRGPHEHGIDESADVLAKALDEGLPLTDRISLTEAALIKYFQPVYNRHFKRTSLGKHSSYLEVVKQDLSAVAVTISMSPVTYAKLWSSTVAARQHHYAVADLRDPKIYKSMFDMF